VQAVILAGGLGTRLRPVIGDLPKPLAPINERPFLEYQIETLRAAGFDRFVLCVGYRHDLIETHFADGRALGVQIVYSVESQALGTGGALRLARPLLDETCLVLNGDTYFAADFSQLVAQHTTPATLAMISVPDAGRYGSLSVDGDGFITHFNEKGASGPGLINAGVYVLSSAAFRYMAEQTPLSLETDVFPELARQRLLRGCALDGYHLDIGTPESYTRFERDVRAGRLGRGVQV